MIQAKKKNTNLSENKDKPVIFTLKGFKIVRFNMVEPGLDIVNGFEIQKLKVGYNLDFSYSMEQNGFQVIAAVIYQYNLNGSDIQLLELALMADYHISEIKNIIEISGDNFRIPDDLLVNFVSIAFSTARGILFAKTQGSFLNQFILPLIDPKSIVQQKLKSLETKPTKKL